MQPISFDISLHLVLLKKFRLAFKTMTRVQGKPQNQISNQKLSSGETPKLGGELSFISDIYV